LWEEIELILTQKKPDSARKFQGGYLKAIITLESKYLKANIIFESKKYPPSGKNAEQTGHCFGLIVTKTMRESLNRLVEDLYVDGVKVACLLSNHDFAYR